MASKPKHATTRCFICDSRDSFRVKVKFEVNKGKRDDVAHAYTALVGGNLCSS